MLWLAETEGSIITQARMLEGNPNDAAQFIPKHKGQSRGRSAGQPPVLIAGSLRSPLLLIGFEEFDRVARRIIQENLFPSIPAHDIVTEMRSP